VTNPTALTGHLEPITPEATRSVRRPVMLQGWYDLASVHWRYDPADVARLLPSGFTVDTFDDAAWVGLIPFMMRRIRVPGLPPFGRLSTFPETNVRTYIVDPAGRRAVWFFSLDITRLIPALVARVSYRLPYCWATMSIERSGPDPNRWSYTSKRRWPRGEAVSALTIDVGPPVAPENVTDLEHFLTARWALGSTLGRRLMWADVDHPRWPIHRATTSGIDPGLVTAAGLPYPAGDPVALWSPGVEVRIGRPRLVRQQSR
jgi:uncharacterized protein